MTVALQTHEPLRRLIGARMLIDSMRERLSPNAAAWATRHRAQDRWERRAERVFEEWLRGLRPDLDLRSLVEESRDALKIEKAAATGRTSDASIRLNAAINDIWPKIWDEFLAQVGEDVPQIVGERARALLAERLTEGIPFDSAWAEVTQSVRNDLGLVEKGLLSKFAEAWRKAGETIRSLVRDALTARTVEKIGESVTAQIGDTHDFDRGGMQVYLSLAQDISEEAGQSALDTLGVNRTFRWDERRDHPADLFAVRGSKIIQHATGSHGKELARIIVKHTDPEKPETVQQTTRRIRDQWNELTRKQAERIARTETAALYETTNWNVARNNGVRMMDWTIARGPSIGPPKSYPVCPLCLREAAGNPYPITEVDLPPRHPNCRCHLVPRLPDDWLPPAEPFMGNNPPLPLQPAEAP